MNTKPLIDSHVRDKIIADPDVLLEDQDIMRALVAANEQSMGGNIVDLRGIAMERLEARLDRLEDTHRSVIAAAYENLAGTNQVHRAVLRMMDATKFETFLQDLSGDVLIRSALIACGWCWKVALLLTTLQSVKWVPF